MPMQLPAAVTMAEAAAVHQQVQAALAGNGGAVFAVDASALRNFDTSALAVLLAAHRGALSRGWRFELQVPPPKLQQLASLYGVAELLGLASTGGPSPA
jgi:phospholipid transport system transporter-binding protein